MKKHFPWHLIGMLLAVSAVSSAVAASSSNVVMTFVHPERFTDFRVQDRNEWDSAAWFTRNMTEALAPTVAQQAPGCTLAFRFTDIDLGGRYRRNLSNHVRFYDNGREPIRLYFDYTLTDPRGRVIAERLGFSNRCGVFGQIYVRARKTPFRGVLFRKKDFDFLDQNKDPRASGRSKLRGEELGARRRWVLK